MGINTALIFPRQSSRTQTVVASSIAINRAKPIITELINSGKIARPWIGASVHILVPGFNPGQALSVDRGLIVFSVAPGSPADLAGIEQGDIITSADGIPLALPSDLLQVLSDHNIGDKITLAVVKQDGTSGILR